MDTVDLDILLEKISFIVIRGDALKLIENFLEQGWSWLKIDDVINNELIVNIGVPQGIVRRALFT